MRYFMYYLQLSNASIAMTLAIVYLYYNWKRNLFFKFISIAFIVLGYGLFVNFLAFNDLFLIFPHFSRTGMLCVLLIPPLVYLAYKLSLKEDGLSLKNLIHFGFPLVFVLNYAPYFIKSAEEKKEILSEYSIASFGEGLMPSYVFPVLALIQNALYIAVFMKQYKIKHLKRNINNWDFIDHIFILLVLHFLPVIMVLLNLYDTNNITHLLSVIYTLGNIFIFYLIMSSPKFIINKSRQKIEHNLSQNVDKKTAIDKTYAFLNTFHKATSLSVSNLNIEEKTNFINFELKFIKNLSYLQINTNQRRIANELKLSEYKLRMLITKAYGIKFNDLVNYLRIQYLIENYHKDRKWKNLTFKSISNELGYLSVNSFYENFKKITGYTPGEIFKNKVK